MARKRMYSFAEKKQSKRGITSTVLGVLSLVILLVLVYLAFAASGQGGLYLGSIGLLSIVLAVAGISYGLWSFREKDVHYTFSQIGAILNGCVLAAWILMVLVGI